MRDAFADTGGPRRTWRRRATLVARRVLSLLALAGTAACGEGIGVPARARTIDTNVDVEGSLIGAGQAEYALDVPASGGFTIVLTALVDSVVLQLTDASGQAVFPPVASTFRASIARPALSGEVRSSIAQRYRIAVTGRGRFRLRVQRSTPERAPERIVAGRIIEESLDAAEDIDDFSLVASSGDLVIAYVQALDPADARPLSLAFGSSLATVSVVAISTSANQELERQSSGVRVIESAEPYVFRVSGPYQGAYRLFVRVIDPAPERASPVVPLNDVLRDEAIDYDGDIDRFRVPASGRSMINIAFRMLTPDVGRSALLEVDLGPQAQADAQRSMVLSSDGTESTLFARQTGRVSVGVTGEVMLTVRSGAGARGRYELVVHQIDTLSEGSIRSMAPNDSVLSEAIDVPGDVDEFSLSLAQDDTVNVALLIGSPAPSTPNELLIARLRVLDDAGRMISRTHDGGQLTAATGPIPLSAGRYRLIVETFADRRNTFVGPYRLSVYRIRRAPESAPPTISLGGPPVTESLDPPGDADIFSFSARKGELIDLHVSAIAGAGVGDLSAALVRMADGLVIASAYAGLAGSSTPADGRSDRAELPSTADFRVVVASGTGGKSPLEIGGYQLELRRYPSTPERHGGQLVAGTSVVNEAIDIPGDVDDFVLRGPAGAEVTILLDATQFVPSLAMRLLDAATYNVLATRSSFAGPGVFPRVVMRSTGTRLLRVAEARFSSSTGPDFRLQGGYRLDTYVTDRRPESRVPTMAIGDTIDTERLDTPGDIDEFIFAGIAGQTLAGLIDLPRGAREAGLILEILPLGGGPVLASVLANDLPSTLGRTRTPDFVLPVTGNYLVRVRDAVDWRPATDAHRFAIVQR